MSRKLIALTTLAVLGLTAGCVTTQSGVGSWSVTWGTTLEFDTAGTNTGVDADGNARPATAKLDFAPSADLIKSLRTENPDAPE